MIALRVYNRLEIFHRALVFTRHEKQRRPGYPGLEETPHEGGAQTPPPKARLK